MKPKSRERIVEWFQTISLLLFETLIFNFHLAMKYNVGMSKWKYVLHCCSSALFFIVKNVQVTIRCQLKFRSVFFGSKFSTISIKYICWHLQVLWTFTFWIIHHCAVCNKNSVSFFFFWTSNGFLHRQKVNGSVSSFFFFLFRINSTKWINNVVS